MRFFVKLMMLKAVLVLASTAWAEAQQMTCNSQDRLTTILTEQFEERPHVRGLAPNGAMVETWGNEQTGTWTVVVNMPDGRACLLASGSHFTLVYQPGEDLNL